MEQVNPSSDKGRSEPAKPKASTTSEGEARITSLARTRVPVQSQKQDRDAGHKFTKDPGASSVHLQPMMIIPQAKSTSWSSREIKVH